MGNRQGQAGARAEEADGEVKDFLLEARRRLEARFEGNSSGHDGPSEHEVGGSRARREGGVGRGMREPGDGETRDFADNQI